MQKVLDNTQGDLDANIYSKIYFSKKVKTQVF